MQTKEVTIVNVMIAFHRENVFFPIQKFPLFVKFLIILVYHIINGI